MLQLSKIHKQFDTLQATYGEKTLNSVYGAGCVSRPKICLIFMNPTAKNIACTHEWKGIRAPRVGFKQTWRMIHDLGLISDDMLAKTQGPISHWTPDFVNELYTYLAKKGVYITNLAKCTQSDAKALPNSTFKAYLPSTYNEISLLQPKHIVTFGNQVSSIFLGKQIQVSSYEKNQHETITIKNTSYNVYPCRYPVGMGYRNIAKAKERIQSII